MKGIVRISQAGRNHGGKALGLQRLERLGLDVPRAIAIDEASVSKLLCDDPAELRNLAAALRGFSGKLLAIRSSALQEDGHQQSFAGAFDTLLNVKKTSRTVLDAIKMVGTSGRSERIDHYAESSFSVIPVIIQEMVAATRSGVLFSRATKSDGRACAYVEWVHGLGETLVSGRGRPATLTVPWKNAGPELDLDGVVVTGGVPTQRSLRQLANIAQIVDRDHEAPSWDLEWAQDRRGKVWALQMRPVTVDIIADDDRSRSALGASKGIAKGPVRFIDDSNYHSLRAGEILVARITEINYVGAMKRAAAIVTEEGGLLSHAAIVARELKKPCVVGATGALSLLTEGVEAEVNGTLGTIRQGSLQIGNSSSRQQIDWAAVYLYDRGIELIIDGLPVYVEATPNGLTAHVDDQLELRAKLKLQRDIFSLTQQNAAIIVSDRRIWFHEWRRFDCLLSVSLVDCMFRPAIAGWRYDDFIGALEVLRAAAAEVADFKRNAQSPIHKLFWSELGAALHALVALEVEGRAIWAAYRDTNDWRIKNAIPFSDLVSSEADSIAELSGISIQEISRVLHACGTARNEAYLYFAEIDAFDANYFSGRHELVEAAASHLGIEYIDEDKTLNRLYGEGQFETLDRSFALRITKRINGAG